MIEIDANRYRGLKKFRDRDCYFVDKTMMLKKQIDEESAVKLFTRPRRFGKTLNISM